MGGVGVAGCHAACSSARCTFLFAMQMEEQTRNDKWVKSIARLALVQRLFTQSFSSRSAFHASYSPPMHLWDGQDMGLHPLYCYQTKVQSCFTMDYIHIIPLCDWSQSYDTTPDPHKTLYTPSTSFAKRSFPLRAIPRVVLLPGVNSSCMITSSIFLCRCRLSLSVLALVLIWVLLGTSSPRRRSSSFTSLLCSLFLLPGVCPWELREYGDQW